MQHGINEEEIRAFRSLLSAVATSVPGRRSTEQDLDAAFGVALTASLAQIDDLAPPPHRFIHMASQRRG